LFRTQLWDDFHILGVRRSKYNIRDKRFCAN
jgi:hypothetical protein